jgi:hypothetical protein
MLIKDVSDDVQEPPDWPRKIKMCDFDSVTGSGLYDIREHNPQGYASWRRVGTTVYLRFPLRLRVHRNS